MLEYERIKKIHANLDIFTFKIHLLPVGAISPRKDFVVRCGEQEKDKNMLTQMVEQYGKTL